MSLNIIVTGANRGIGLALATQYAEQGNNVFAVCRTPSQALRKSNISVITGVDVTDPKAAQTILNSLEDTKVDVLINNAGILRRETLESAPSEDILEQFTVNALAPLQLTRGLFPALHKGSKIAMITSRLGSMGDNGKGSYYGYRMSKAALNAASVSLALDLKPEGIAVAILHPGFVQTDMVGGAGDITADTAAQQLRQRIEELSMENSGSFWHSNGELLPW